MNTVIDKAVSNIEPQAMNAEQAVIGVLLVRPELLNIVLPVLQQEDFYAEQHRVVYGTMVEMAAGGESTDFVSVQDKLVQIKKLDRAGGVDYLGGMVAAAPSGANIEHHIALIRERSSRRKMIKAADDIKNAVASNGNMEQSAALGIEELFRIMRDGGALKAPETVGKLIPGVLDDIEKRQQGELSGISTGFKDLDEKLLGGLRPGNLILIAGRPSMGKTALGVQIGANAAMDGHSVMVFTLEMSRQQITERLLAQIGGIEFSHILTGHLDETDYDRMAVAIGKLHEIPLLIDDAGGVSMQDIAARARAQAKSGKLSMIVVDYLQIMGYNGRSLSRNDQLGETSRQMKALAKELNVAVVLLSQLNRDVEKRMDKRPLMSDLRESGAIEQDADVIIMVYRDEYYNPDSEFKGVAEALVRKNRNGEVGVVGLRFEGEKVKFSNLQNGSAWSMNDD